MTSEDGRKRTGSAARIPGFESHASSTAGGPYDVIECAVNCFMVDQPQSPASLFCRLDSGHCQQPRYLCAIVKN